MQNESTQSDYEKMLKRILETNKTLLEANKISMETTKILEETEKQLRENNAAILAQNNNILKELLKKTDLPARAIVSPGVKSGLKYFLITNTQ